MSEPYPVDPTCSAPPVAILFDCDGTLLLTADLHFIGISGAIRLQGMQMPRDWYMSLTGLGRRDLFARFASDFATAPDLSRLVSDSIALTVAQSCHAQENPLVAGLARVASGALPIAVVTNSEAAIAKAFLVETALHDLFDCIVTVEDAPRPKPAPDLYRIAAARLGVSPEHCLVLEDSDQGLVAAQAAGMQWIDVRCAEWPSRCEGLMRHLAGSPPDSGCASRGITA